MSYILEALKKAEHQREIGQVPRIDSEHEAAASKLSSRWGMIVVLVLLVNAGLLLVLFWPGSSTNSPEPVAVSPNISPATKTTRPPGGLHRDRSVAVQNLPARGALQPRRENTHAGGSESVSSPASVAIPPQPAARVVPALRVAPLQAPRSAAIVPVAPPAPKPRITDLPVWPQVPTHIFQQLHGNLRLDVLVYSDQPGDRFVLINLQKYHEGDRLQEGPIVDEITAEGVVLSQQGEQFLLLTQ